ncbi:hypothetical protein [Rhizobium sp. BT-226]|uniref:hypothetical protein n=1 Tax=Rhizobium sp. BT-226 TaxID=2986922 RepID=UPI0021F7E2F5|nr:hypothetical protein [Rhizobium sp. BT-226]MCW0020465.1 hypothetical protein [Rhizobium sp. BT-226]
MKARIYFKIDMTGVRIEDVLDGYNPVGQWPSVAAGSTKEISPTDIGGIATVDIHGKGVSNSKDYDERTNLRHGERYDFPPGVSSALDEIPQFGDLGELAREIDKILKNTPSPAAKSSRAAKLSLSAPKGPK